MTIEQLIKEAANGNIEFYSMQPFGPYTIDAPIIESHWARVTPTKNPSGIRETIEKRAQSWLWRKVGDKEPLIIQP